MGCTFIGITTLGEETNFVNRLFELKRPGGDPVFKTVRIEQVCDKCKKLGLESSCTHKMGEIPPWQDEGRIGDIEYILKNDPESLLTETKGVMGYKKVTQVFETRHVKEFRKRIIQSGQEAVTHLYIAVDPNGCGSSACAIITFFRNIHNKWVLVACETVKGKSFKDNQNVLLEHIKKLRSMTDFANSTIVFIAEANLGNEGERMAYFLLEQPNLGRLVAMKEHKRHDTFVYGIYTTNQSKIDWVTSLAEIFITNNIYVYERFFTLTAQTSEDMLDEIDNQLCGFCRRVVEPHTPRGKVSIFYDGKAGGKNDDIICAMMLIPIMCRSFLTNPIYENIK